MKRILSIIAISSLPFVSQADTYNVSDNFYVGLGAGMISPNDVDIDISAAGTVNGVTFSEEVLVVAPSVWPTPDDLLFLQNRSQRWLEKPNARTPKSFVDLHQAFFLGQR